MRFCHHCLTLPQIATTKLQTVVTICKKGVRQDNLLNSGPEQQFAKNCLENNLRQIVPEELVENSCHNLHLFVWNDNLQKDF